MCHREEINALVIRYRIYLSNQFDFITTENQRFDFASEVLNITARRAQNIFYSKENKRIKHLSKQDCIKELKQKAPEMYVVALSDIIHKRYMDLLDRIREKDDEVQRL
ncbi:MAG: hypothetical protein IJ759_07595 [Bacteroidales bacterium]|nr:hypothetical protein [Bacteroidales bacterium]